MLRKMLQMNYKKQNMEKENCKKMDKVYGELFILHGEFCNIITK